MQPQIKQYSRMAAASQRMVKLCKARFDVAPPLRASPQGKLGGRGGHLALTCDGKMPSPFGYARGRLAGEMPAPLLSKEPPDSKSGQGRRRSGGDTWATHHPGL